MTVTTLISCPACARKFKGRPDLLGKKVRCPACAHAFVVEALAPATEERAKAPKARAGATRPARAQAGAKARPPALPAGDAKTTSPPSADTEDEEGYGHVKAYDATELDLAPRCPHCANEMESADAVVCLFCGYNTETRTIGQTKKIVQTTGGEHFMWLLPGLLSLLGVILLGVLCLYFCLEVPALVKDRGWLKYLDHESMRMWVTMIGLIIMWGGSIFAYKRLIMQPMPPEKKND